VGGGGIWRRCREGSGHQLKREDVEREAREGTRKKGTNCKARERLAQSLRRAEVRTSQRLEKRARGSAPNLVDERMKDLEERERSSPLEGWMFSSWSPWSALVEGVNRGSGSFWLSTKPSGSWIP